MIGLVCAVARLWVRLYTRGLDPAARDARRAEIECDLWEQRHAECGRRRPFLTAFDVVGRVVRGAPSDLSWRRENRIRGAAARRLRVLGAAARRHRWTVFPALVELSYITGAAQLGTPSFVDTPEQLAMAAGAAAILCGMALLWRATLPVTAAWLVCVGALAPALLLARSVPLLLLWAGLAARSAVRRSDALRADRPPAALA
jgi:hypothetical protein